MPCRVPKRRFSCGAPQHLTKNLFVSCGKILANGFKLQGTVLFLSKDGVIPGLIPVWMLTIHLLVFCFVKLRENLFLNLQKSRVPTPIF